MFTPIERTPWEVRLPGGSFNSLPRLNGPPGWPPFTFCPAICKCNVRVHLPRQKGRMRGLLSCSTPLSDGKSPADSISIPHPPQFDNRAESPGPPHRDGPGLPLSKRGGSDVHARSASAEACIVILPALPVKNTPRGETCPKALALTNLPLLPTAVQNAKRGRRHN